MAEHVPVRERVIAEPRTGRLVATWLDFFQRIGQSYGTWVPVPFVAASFTGAGAMTWTVAAADQVTFAYCLMGKRLEVAFVIARSTVGGTPGPALQIAIPGTDRQGQALVAATDMRASVWIDHHGTQAIGVAAVAAGGRMITVQRVDAAPFAAATHATSVAGQIAVEVQ